MDPHVQRALAAIDAAARAVASEPPISIDPEYRRLIQAVEALPENQDGADKSWVWPTYEFCRRHFESAIPAP